MSPHARAARGSAPAARTSATERSRILTTDHVEHHVNLAGVFRLVGLQVKPDPPTHRRHQRDRAGGSFGIDGSPGKVLLVEMIGS